MAVGIRRLSHWFAGGRGVQSVAANLSCSGSRVPMARCYGIASDRRAAHRNLNPRARKGRHDQKTFRNRKTQKVSHRVTAIPSCASPSEVPPKRLRGQPRSINTKSIQPHSSSFISITNAEDGQCSTAIVRSRAGWAESKALKATYHACGLLEQIL